MNSSKTLQRLRTISLFVILIINFGCWHYISEEAQERFKNRNERFSVTIFPVHVVIGDSIIHDYDLAQKLSDFLNEEKIVNSRVCEKKVSVPIHWKSNQAKMAQESALKFGEEIKKIKTFTEYGLLVEILCLGKESKVGGVHYYLSDKNGLIADGRLSNSHWAEFKEVNPKNRSDGLEVVKRMLRNNWKKQ